jgi:4-hydroxythreonine-4-phosphate dehydrogenase
MKTTPTHHPPHTTHTSRIALTIGDPAGIGPELVAKLLASDAMSGEPFLVCSPPGILESAATVAGANLGFDVVDSLDAIDANAARVVVYQGNIPDCRDVNLGEPTALTGQAAYESLVSAMTAAEQGIVSAIVTAPLSKLALHLAGHDVPGHTELLARRFGVEQVAMMLYVPPSGELPQHGLAVAHATLHTSIASVPGLLSVERISGCIGLVDGFLQQVGVRKPRIGVCALNPHAGEEGLFGDEESRLIAPSVAMRRQSGLDVTGPIPADALIRRALHGEFDGVVAMFHDQGHIPLKLVAFQRAVNVTLGLPIVRTSPSHGTAFDIAGQGKADPSGMLAAVHVARMLIAPKLPTPAATRPAANGDP